MLLLIRYIAFKNPLSSTPLNFSPFPPPSLSSLFSLFSLSIPQVSLQSLRISLHREILAMLLYHRKWVLLANFANAVVPQPEEEKATPVEIFAILKRAIPRMSYMLNLVVLERVCVCGECVVGSVCFRCFSSSVVFFL